jgi:hypothetical protein
LKKSEVNKVEKELEDTGKPSGKEKGGISTNPGPVILV